MNSYAVVLNHNPVIHIMNISDSTTNQRIPHMSILLAHELAHCFGAEDVYSQVTPTEHKSNLGWNCLVGSMYTANNASVAYYDDLVAGNAEPFCDACRSAIESGLYYWPNVG